MKQVYTKQSNDKQDDMIYLALGTNLGNRLRNLQIAIDEISKFFDVKMQSHIIETSAILLPNAKEGWDVPYCNMVIAGKSAQDPLDLLSRLKAVEAKLGRRLDDAKWAPRVIDLDIVSYYGRAIDCDALTIPHKEIANRDFLQFLLLEIGYVVPENIKLDISQYSPINHFILNPKFVGIVNVTPDSFSDGGCFLSAENAIHHAHRLYQDGAFIVELGAQSTRPGHKEVGEDEEIRRLESVLTMCSDIDISIDTYCDKVVTHTIKNHKNVKWINDQNSKLQPETIKSIADHDMKLVVMLHGMDLEWFKYRVQILENLGVKKDNIIVDPGIGFGKKKHENISMIKNMQEMNQIGCEIMLAHSRKSFMSLFSSGAASNRDVETIAVSAFAHNMMDVDYIRVHNVRDHMKFFVSEYCVKNFNF